MKIDFPYNEMFEPVEVPDQNLLGVYEPAVFNSVENIEEHIAHAIDNQLGCSSLPELATGCRSALIISDDYTRQTPVDIITPIILRILRRSGINDIRILIALGTHRPMSQQETLKRFGSEIPKQIPIIQHDYKDLDTLTDLGTSPSGMRLTVNSALFQADLVIGLGQIVPHRIAGFSGGSKIILPGICGEEAIAKTHWLGSLQPGEKMLGVEENPIRAEMDSAAEKCKLRFIVNAVCDPAGRLIGIFAGDYVTAHRAGCKLAREVFGVKIPELADIVIADSYPKDIELWQAAKALYASDLMVKPGGVVILVSPCTEGISRSHPEILKRGYTDESCTLADVESGELSNLAAAAHCLRVGRLIKEKTTGIMVKNGISKQDMEHLGFTFAASAQEALGIAFDRLGTNAKVAVLRRGGEAMPVLGIEKA